MMVTEEMVDRDDNIETDITKIQPGVLKDSGRSLHFGIHIIWIMSLLVLFFHPVIVFGVGLIVTCHLLGCEVKKTHQVVSTRKKCLGFSTRRLLSMLLVGTLMNGTYGDAIDHGDVSSIVYFNHLMD